MFQLIGTPRRIEHLMFLLKDMPQGFNIGSKQIQDMNEILVGHNPIRRHDSKISMGRKHSVSIKEYASSK